MFAGVGGEILYRPVDSNLAYGLDIAYVKQRDPYSQTGLEDYTAVTGHASVYWQPEFLDDTQITVSAGQFLAKDKGVNSIMRSVSIAVSLLVHMRHSLMYRQKNTAREASPKASTFPYLQICSC